MLLEEYKVTIFCGIEVSNLFNDGHAFSPSFTWQNDRNSYPIHLFMFIHKTITGQSVKTALTVSENLFPHKYTKLTGCSTLETKFSPSRIHIRSQVTPISRSVMLKKLEQLK